MAHRALNQVETPERRPFPRKPLSRWWIVGGVATGALLVGGLVFLARRALAAEGPAGPAITPTSGGGKIIQHPDAPTGPSTVPTSGGPSGRGPSVFGFSQIPTGWNPEGNGIYISPNCDLVLEGKFFEPVSKGLPITGIEGETLVDTLAADPENSVYGYIDYLIITGGFREPTEIAEQVMREANALCADVPFWQRPPALAQWFDSFVARISPWVEETAFGIGFDASTS
jgi:hypothetical protein